jgi:protein TonB
VKNQLQREKRPGQTVKVRPVIEQTSHKTPIVPPRVIEKAPEVPTVSHSVIDHPVLRGRGVDKMPQLVEEKATPALRPTSHEVPIIPPRVIDMAQVTPIATYDVIDHPALLEESVGKMPELFEEKGRSALEQIPQRKEISLPKAIQASLEVPIPIHGLIEQNAPLEETLGGMRPLSEEDKGIGTGLQAYAPDRGTNKVVEAKPNYAINPKPLYPKRAIRRGYEGTVTLLVEVLSNGSVRYVEIVGSSGYPILDRSAQKTVRKWRFIPGKRGEEPVTMKVKVPVVFRLKKARDG